MISNVVTTIAASGPADPVGPTVPRRPTRRRVLRAIRWALFCVLAVAALLGINGWVAQPTGTATGGPIAGLIAPSPAGKTTFRAGIFNMHSGVGTDEVRNIGRIADSIRDTDICALNEVRGRLMGASEDQTHQLALATGRPCLFLPTERRFWHEDFGNALLTRLPVTHWARLPLPSDGAAGGYRNVTIAQVDVGGRTLNVLITHINPLAIQSAQIRMVANLFQSLQTPALLLADLNADFKQPDVQALLAAPGVHDCLAETVVGPKSGRVDWIFSRGLKTVNGGRIDIGASDHAMFWVDLELVP